MNEVILFKRLGIYVSGLTLWFCAFIYGIGDLQFSNYHWLEDDNPVRIQQEFSNKTFHSGESFLIVVKIPESFFQKKYISELQAIQLALSEKLPDTLVQSPLKNKFAYRHDDTSIDFLEYDTALRRGLLTIEEFRASFKKSSAFGNLLSKDEKSFLLSLEKDIGENSIERSRITNTVKGIFANSAIFTNFRTAGAMHLNQELDERSLQNIKKFTPLVFFIVLLLLFIFYRRWQEPIIILTNCLLAMLVSFLGSKILGYPITAISLSLPITIMVIATADSIFILNQWRNNYTLPLAERMKTTFKQLWLPCFYVSVTTAIGFGSFSFSDIVPLREFGILSFLSITAASTIVVLHSILASGIINPNAKPTASNSNYWTKLGEFSIRYRKHVVWGTVFCIIFWIFGFQYYRTETNFLDVFFPKKSSTYQSFEIIDDELSGTGQIQLIFSSNQSEYFKEIDNFNKINAIQEEINKFEEVTSTTSMREAVSIVHSAFTDDQETLPNNQNALAQDLLFLEFSKSDRENDALAPYVDFDYKNSRIIIRTKNQSSDETKQLRTKITNVLNQYELDYFLTGPSIYFQSLSALVVDTQYQSFLITGIINLIIFLIHFPLMLALIGSFATIIPTIGVIGIICWSRVPFDFSTVLIGSISEGLVVDMVIHFMFHQRYHKGDTPETLRALGAPITWTIILLSTGFIVFVGSDLVVLQRFGIFNTVSLALALLATLVTLPALLSWALPNKNPIKRT